MIIKAFSEYIKSFNTEIPAINLLPDWIRKILSKKPENNVERIIHHELGFLENKQGFYLLIGKNNSGKILLDSLYEYALSYDNHKFSKWVHNVKASDFNQ